MSKEAALDSAAKTFELIHIEACRNITALGGSARRGDGSMCMNWIFVRDMAQEWLKTHTDSCDKDGSV